MPYGVNQLPARGIRDLSPTEARQRLVTRIRRFRVDMALSAINRLFVIYIDPDARNSLPKHEQSYWGRSITPHALAYLAWALIDVSNDFRNEPISFDGLADLVNLYHQSQGSELGDDASIDDWGSFFLRTAFVQFKRQEAMWSLIARTWLLYGSLAREHVAATEIDIAARFHDLYGMPVEDFLAIGFWLFAAYCSDPERPAVFTTADLRASNIPATAEQINSFLEAVSGSYSTLRFLKQQAMQDKRASSMYRFNPLEARPIVQTTRSAMVIPVPAFLLYKITAGVYYDMIRTYGEPFARSLGIVFEKYVGVLLQEYYDPEHLICEQSYGKRGGKRTTDWIIREGDSGILLECKIARMSLGSRAIADAQHLNADLARGVVKGLRQVYQVVNDIRASNVPIHSLQSIKQFVPVIVMLEDFHFANTSMIRSLVETQLVDAGIEPFDYQIVSSRELERFTGAMASEGLANVLITKMADKSNSLNGTAFMDVGTYTNLA